MFANLRQAGEPFGIKFGNPTLLSNSQLALEVSEFAKDQGSFNEFHEKIFFAYFTEGKDIGNMEVILETAKKSGLDINSLQEALNDGKYIAKLAEAQQQGKSYGITGTPTFVVNDQYKIVGAQPVEAIRDYLHQLEKASQ
jgi:predicted DsbA family dithiol-disulfide isomerase